MSIRRPVRTDIYQVSQGSQQGLYAGIYKLFVSNTIIAAILKGMEAGVAALMVDLIADMCFLIVKKRSFFFPP